MQTVTILKNINVFDPVSGTFHMNRDIILKGERIAELSSPGREYGDDILQFDCSGKYAVPGLFECHAHLSGLTLEEPDKCDAAIADFPRKGITQVRDVGGPLDILRKLAAEIADGRRKGPDIFYAGPMLEKPPCHWESENEKLPGFTEGIDSVDDALAMVERLRVNGARIVKTFNRFDPAVFGRLVETAQRAGLFVVHDPGMPFFNSIPMDKAIDHGVRSIEHGKAPWPVVLRDDLREEHDRLFAGNADFETQKNFMKKVSEMALESVDEHKLQELIETMQRTNTCLCPTLHVFRSVMEELNQMPPEQKEHISRRMRNLIAVSEYFAGEMARQGCRILVGQDGDDPEFTFNEMELLRKAGAPELEILRGATSYPAEFLGVADVYGRVAPGYSANILVVEADPLECIGHLRQRSLVIHRGIRI